MYRRCPIMFTMRNNLRAKINGSEFGCRSVINLQDNYSKQTRSGLLQSLSRRGFMVQLAMLFGTVIQCMGRPTYTGSRVPRLTTKQVIGGFSFFLSRENKTAS